MTTPIPTLYGGTLTTIFTTTLTFTPNQESITILYPWPAITSPLQYTTSLPTSPGDKEFPSGLPILILTDVVGIIEDTTGEIVKTATLIQLTPSVGVVGETEVSERCLEWRCWSEEKKIGVLMAIGLLVMGILGVVWWALCCRRKKKKKVERRGDVESGKRRGRRKSRRNRERGWRRRDSVSSIERRRGEGSMGLSSDSALATVTNQSYDQVPPVIQRQESKVSSERRRISISGVPSDIRPLSTPRQNSRPPPPPDQYAVPLQMPPFPPSRSRSISTPRRNSKLKPPPGQYTTPLQMPPFPRSRSPVTRVRDFAYLGDTSGYVRKVSRVNAQGSPIGRDRRRYSAPPIATPSEPRYENRRERSRSPRRRIPDISDDSRSPGPRRRNSRRERHVTRRRSRSRSVSPIREEKSKAKSWIPWAALLTLGLKLLHDIGEPKGGWHQYHKDSGKKTTRKSHISRKSHARNSSKRSARSENTTQSHTRRHSTRQRPGDYSSSSPTHGERDEGPTRRPDHVPRRRSTRREAETRHRER